MAKEEKTVVHQQPNAIQRYWSETVGELRKVSWPTRREAMNLTKIVLLVVFSMAIFLGTLDYIFSWFFTQLLSLG